jgi:hypothetical protein
MAKVIYKIDSLFQEKGREVRGERSIEASKATPMD